MSAPATQLAVSLQNVSVRFGDVLALNEVSFDIAPGEWVGFVGSSGSGKTTLLRTLNGMQLPTSGTVRIGESSISGSNERERRLLRTRIGYVPQQFSLVASLRVLQNVLLGRLGQQRLWTSLRALLFPKASDLLTVHEILERVGLADKLYARTDTLSGGEQQRVAIARSLYQNPRILLADEPVASVDPERARATLALLTNLAREEGLTFCISLHDQFLARTFLPRLIGLQGGRLVKDAPSAEWSDADFHQLYALPHDNKA